MQGLQWPLYHADRRDRRRGETIADTARVLSRYVDAIMIRTLGHDMLMELAGAASVPVINGLTKLIIRQVMADVMTFGRRRDRSAAARWRGSAMRTMWPRVLGPCGRALRFTLRIATPESLAPKPALRKWAESARAKVTVMTDPRMPKARTAS